MTERIDTYRATPRPGRSLIRLAALLLAALCVLPAAALAQAGPPPGFVRAEGRDLVRDGRKIILKAISFSNFYGYPIGQEGFHPTTSGHHDEIDFRRVRRLGFNAIRLGFNGNWFLDDRDGFFRWLDRNLAWAERHDLMLTLDLHVPIGGDWLSADIADPDFSLWTDQEKQRRNLELWQAIASRYRDRPAIAGYELLNEAVTTDATGQQYRDFLERTVAAIREVDPNHLLVVGALYGTQGQYDSLDPGDFFLVDDANVMYDFHFYEPVEFTHQTATWLSRPVEDGGRYPDPDRLIPVGPHELASGSGIATGCLYPGDTDWRTYHSGWITLDDPRVIAALPVVVMRGDVRGEVLFGDIEVFEKAPGTPAIRRRVHDPLSPGTIGQWWHWDHRESGRDTATFRRRDGAGQDDAAGLSIDRRSPDQLYWGWSSDRNWFRTRQGHAYMIVGRMRGREIDYPGNDLDACIAPQIDFYRPGPDGDTPAFLARDKSYLAHLVTRMTAFGETHDVPMSVMEFGVMRSLLSDPGKGGGAWIADAISLFRENRLSFALWHYHGPAMGLFSGDFPGRPAEASRPLIEAVRQSLAPAD